MLRVGNLYPLACERINISSIYDPTVTPEPIVQVRANNLQDLVYKRGQAGISKASVTIVFNNEDRDRSPPGYENNKQISVTRQVGVDL